MMPSMSCWRPSTCLYCHPANHTRNREVATQLLRILSHETRKIFLLDQNRLHDRRGNADRQEDWSWTLQGRSTTFVRRVRASQSGARQKTIRMSIIKSLWPPLALSCPIHHVMLRTFTKYYCSYSLSLSLSDRVY